MITRNAIRSLPWEASLRAATTSFGQWRTRCRTWSETSSATIPRKSVDISDREVVQNKFQLGWSRLANVDSVVHRPVQQEHGTVGTAFRRTEAFPLHH